MDHSSCSERHQQDQLNIYVSQHCSNCQEALAIAQLAGQIAGLEVCVIDLDQPEAMPRSGPHVPPCVIGVPTYLLNGAVISQGNPRRKEFLLQLQQKVQKIKEER